MTLWRLLLRLVVWTGVLGGLAVLALGVLGPVADGPMGRVEFVSTFLVLCSAVFRPHVGIALAALGVLGVLIGVRGGGVVALAAAAAVWGSIGWLWVRPLPAETGTNETEFTVCSANVLYTRSDAERLRAQLEQADADVVLIQEWTTDWDRAIGPWLRERYPFHTSTPRLGAFGQAVFTRLPVVGGPTMFRLGDSEIDQTRIVVSTEAGPVEVWCVHVPPPSGRWYIAEQRQQLVALAEQAETAVRPIVMAGDFNTSYLTPFTRELRAAGMHEAHAEAGRGDGATWPRLGPQRWAPNIRLDHVMFRGPMRAVEARVLGDVGSDHRPVFARLAVREGGME